MKRAERAGPRRLGERFELGELIARGAMGLVYRAVDQRTGEAVAVKLIDPAVASVLNRSRFDRECRALMKLAHPRVIRLVACDVAAPTPFLAMELLDGETLASRLSRARFTEPEAVACLGAILEGLAHLHRTGLVHRDVKPANIILDRARGPVLIDFGIARPVEPGTLLTAPGTLVGSLRYLAPELVLGAAVSRASDVFSAGMVGLEMLSDTDVHADGTGGSEAEFVLSSLASGTYWVVATRLLQPFPALGPVLLKALEARPENRFRTAAEMAAGLEALRGPRSGPR